MIFCKNKSALNFSLYYAKIWERTWFKITESVIDYKINFDFTISGKAVDIFSLSLAQLLDGELKWSWVHTFVGTVEYIVGTDGCSRRCGFAMLL